MVSFSPTSPLSPLVTTHCRAKREISSNCVQTPSIVNLSPSVPSPESSGIHGEEKTEIHNSAGSFHKIPRRKLIDWLGQRKITFNLPDKVLHRCRVKHEHTWPQTGNLRLPYWELARRNTKLRDHFGWGLLYCLFLVLGSLYAIPYWRVITGSISLNWAVYNNCELSSIDVAWCSLESYQYFRPNMRCGWWISLSRPCLSVDLKKLLI